MDSTAKVLVLGGSGGIGSAVVRRIVASGGRAFIAGREPTRLAEVAAETGCLFGVVEATDPDAVDAIADRAVEALGGLTGLVNCVGSILLKPAHLTSAADWQATIAANLTTAFACVRSAGRVLRGDGGSVVLVSSAAARIGLPNHEAIAAAKGGIEGLVRAAAATYASAGIRINAVAPGLVKTPMTQRLWEDPQIAQASMQMHALGRLGEPGDIARAIAFLVDPANSWITGQVLGVDGGLGSLVPRRRA